MSSGRLTIALDHGDLRRLKRTLKKSVGDTRREMGPVLKAGAASAAAAAAAAAPRGTGPMRGRSKRLAESTGYKVYEDSPAAIIWAGSQENYHAAFVEHGTRKMRAQPYFARTVGPIMRRTVNDIIRRLKGRRRT